MSTTYLQTEHNIKLTMTLTGQEHIIEQVLSYNTKNTYVTTMTTV